MSIFRKGVVGDRFGASLHEAGMGSKEVLLSWEQIFEYASWGVVLVGPPLASILAVNPAYARMHGYTVEELKGQRLAVTLTPQALARLKRNLKIADENGHCIFDSMHVRKDGTTFPVVAELKVVKDDRGNVLARWENAQDATERKRLEQRLHEKQKMESLGVLAGGLAHDFNNLLTIIMGCAHLALEMQPPNGAARAPLAEAIRASEKAAGLTRQMLAYSGKGGFVIQPVNLSDEVRTAAEFLHPSLKMSAWNSIS